MTDVQLHHGDCLDVLRSLPDCSVDAVVTDPPYGLEFMGKAWDKFDHDSRARAGMSKPGIGDREIEWPSHMGGLNPKCRACGCWQRGANPCRCESPDFPNERRARSAAFGEWCESWAVECLRVLKPGGHMLAFGGTRTWHRLACAVEDAGFEVRDSLAWLYGSGFPKSLDVSKAIDKAAGAERTEGGREWSGGQRAAGILGDNLGTQVRTIYDAPATDAARTWQGWGTALKPAFEPVVVARKPLVGTVAGNVLAWGTGGLNVDACRIGTSGGGNACSGGEFCECVTSGVTYSPTKHPVRREGEFGRWPANVVLDEVAAGVLDQQSGELTSGTLAAHHARAPKEAGILGAYGSAEGERGFGDTGGASRFMYVAKADAAERVRVNGVSHPTVKPLALMRWLVRLVTPPGGTVLEPFAGSGTTVEACILEGFNCIAIEREADYLPLIRQRIARRRDPVQAVKGAGDDGGLFDLLEGESA